ncbi:type IV secretion system protein [Pectobacterium sp. FL60-S17]|uniref:Type IV secretion system protein VirB8 n=1 Tax=Lonsdalea quercina TaxID=71657 RepID=A0A1H3ZEE2_9GAMM|nr:MULTISPECIES: type IV secretion system protein [Pectobacteriaceae]GKW26566.1 pilus assembly protein [Pectobacterium carotovorum subsp. carotovorum]AYH27256.1 type IV secretion system protein [Pectobacterium parmentieri]MBE5202796.1 type IV secretion system protein [Pectobacterium quasiaquaticum]MBE5210920.1 type IV secretion system protein [Pectobacterium quasiaquaticum]MBE5221257.1 type IV secretion system protein [Pectobacterium quasiaquaticum]
MSETENIIASSRAFESVLLEKDEREKKMAWRIAAIGFALAAMAITALIILLPLKTTEIELWSVDKQTGRYEYMTRIKEQSISTEKALAQALAAHYVRLREGYNYFALQRDYDDVQLFNSDSVNRDYLDGFNSNQAPDVIFNKAEYVVSIDIISNVHATATAPDHLATLRIKRTIRRIVDNSVKTDVWNIRLTYRYLPRKQLTDSQREVNPLGFIVTSYQRDKELRGE